LVLAVAGEDEGLIQTALKERARPHGVGHLHLVGIAYPLPTGHKHALQNLLVHDRIVVKPLIGGASLADIRMDQGDTCHDA
jgi:hypothetical protein